MEAADAECPAEPFDAEHPLFILYTSGSTAKPKGILHTTGGYLTQVAYTHKAVFDLKPEEDVYWCSADVGWVTGHSYIVYGPLANGATSVMYEGAPDYPDKDIWWELCERYGVTIFYTAPTAIRACIKWGAEYPGAPRPVLAAAARHGRRADQPEGLALVPQGDRRRALPDRRHLVADRDRRDHDHDAAGRRRDTKPGSAGKPLPGIEAAVVDDEQRGRRHGAGLPHARAPVAGDAAHALQGGGPLHRDLLVEVRPRRPTPSATPRGATTTATSGSSGASTTCSTSPGHRMSTAEIESAIVSYSQGRRGGGDRPGRRGHGPVRDGVRDARGRRRRRRRARSATSASTSPSGSASSRGPSASSGPTTCPRRARARSCAGCCATSPRAASWAT